MGIIGTEPLVVKIITVTNKQYGIKAGKKAFDIFFWFRRPSLATSWHDKKYHNWFILLEHFLSCFWLWFAYKRVADLRIQPGLALYDR